ncbi:aspartate aminotransferase family protein [Candidatus Bathyarchaeota archaeon]|jgi:acetylornithine/LysW-gamma-L-lysine aminotransferase|nr:MAG: aspartate aminotransferase family protein [Candidatus Bathyarchaeota archaeon]
MNEKEIIDIEQKYMANVYAKKSLTLVKGKGALVWDINDQEYIDCMAGYGVCIVGHCHPRVVKAIQKQAELLISAHGSIYNEARSRFLKKLINITPNGLTQAFFSNSGAESIEAAIKLARKYTGKTDIIAFVGGYHGKTMGALSATWKKKYRQPFLPLVPGFIHVPFGKSDRVKDAITEKTAAILVEPIQGERGIILPPPNFLKELREICDSSDILFIVDEVQSGFGRTGKFFACDHYNVLPDIMCIAKSIAGGVPMGVTVSTQDIMSAFTLGNHSNTFGGNPLACAAASAAIDVLIEEKLPERAASLGKYFMGRLEELQDKYKLIREVRGLGLMIGMQLRFDILNILQNSLKRNVLLLDAGRTVIRFLPPLVITREQLDRVVNVLDTVIGEEESERLRR